MSHYLAVDLKHTQFKNGYFIWDELNNCLLFVSRDARDQRLNSAASGAIAFNTAKPVQTEARVRENIDSLTQARYRKYFQRRVKITEPEVVTIQDVKDVAIFITNPAKLSREFVSYLHTSAMDKFLRSLIVYFQYYFQVWDKMQIKRSLAARKLHQPLVTTVENIDRDDLADLRGMVARNYAVILMGLGDAAKYHHMANKNNVSLSDKDRRMFECLMPMAVRIVWLALFRKQLTLIETELNRMLRTNIFSPIKHRKFKSTAYIPLPEENRILLGRAFRTERKLKHRSPAIQELIFDDHDYRMLAIGVLELQPSDNRQTYLEAAYEAPEEMLVDLKVGVGILGLPRKNFDAMLKSLEKKTKQQGRRVMDRTMPQFVLPPKVDHCQTKINMTLPHTPCKYTETDSTIAARQKQCAMWRKYITDSSNVFQNQWDSQSGNQSFMLSTRTSILT